MTNSRCLNDKPQIFRAENPCENAAQFALQNGAALLLAANESDAALVRRALAKQDGMIPPVLTPPQLAEAAENFPPEKLPGAARLVKPDFAAKRRKLAMEIRELIRGQNPNAVPLSAAESLAALFEEFIEEYPALVPPPDAMPKLCKKMDGFPEAELLAALWEILREGALLAPRRALAEFARNAPPLVYAAETPRPPWLDDFLRQCAGGAAIFESPDSESAGILDKGAGAFSAPEECMHGAADSLGGAARLALAAVSGLAKNNRSVGVVVYDRLLARRLRAAAENAGVYIEDDGGWRMETLSFGGALREWADLAAGGFSAAAFGRQLRAPYWAEDSRRPAAEYAWRKLLADSEKRLPERWADFRNLSAAAFHPFAEMFISARRKMPQTAPPAEWVRWLLSNSAAPLAAWENDAVAARLRAALCRGAEGGGLPAAEFCEWLGFFMRTETSGAFDVSSRVRFVPPKTSRRFDGLVLLGADAENLPPPQNPLLGDKGRELLELPARRIHTERQFAQFARLLSAHSRIALVRSKTDEEGREKPPSPFWELFLESARARGVLPKEICPPPPAVPEKGISPPPRPAPRARRLPVAFGITAASRLMECPYRFFARDILRLDDEDGGEEMDAAGLGMLLHRGMKQFAEAAGEERDSEKLLFYWRETFSAMPAVRPGAAFALRHWLLRGEHFIRNESARRAEGWIPRLLEHKLAAELMLGGKQIRIAGRLDRADENGGEWEIIDYKSGGGPGALELRLGEEPQLPLYAFLLGKQTAQWRACYPANPDKDAEGGGTALRIAARLRSAAKKIAAGAAMPAHGAPKTCARCEANGLCRRGHWAQFN